MNAHQRRKHSRRIHMALPLGKEVVFIEPVWPFATVKTTVFRHTPRQAPHTVDICWHYDDKPDVIRAVPLRNVRLKHAADRAARPWWATTAIKHKRGAA